VLTLLGDLLLGRLGLLLLLEWRTDCWHFVSVLGLVDCESALLAETFAAYIALEGLFFAVDVFVVAEVVLSSESLAANITRERALVCVCALVDEEVVAFGEFTVTIFADVSLLGSAEPSARAEEKSGEVRVPLKSSWITSHQ